MLKCAEFNVLYFYVINYVEFPNVWQDFLTPTENSFSMFAPGVCKPKGSFYDFTKSALTERINPI